MNSTSATFPGGRFSERLGPRSVPFIVAPADELCECEGWRGMEELKDREGGVDERLELVVVHHISTLSGCL
jgi:hypothetical protein